jgi:hypothetical protein
MFAEKSSEVMRISGQDDSHDKKSAHLVEDAKLGETPFTSSGVPKTVGHIGPWVRAAQLPELFCSWDLAYRCTKGGWLRPIVQGKRRTIYRLADVFACMQRIEAGELPLPRRSKAAQLHGD